MTSLRLNKYATENVINELKENFISQEPSDYFREKTDVAPEALALFSFYEAKQNEIYGIIRNNDPALLFELDNQAPAAALIDIFSPSSDYNKDKICFKTKQEIPCVSDDPKVESYLKQSKKDWNRAQYFSSKYNKYFINVTDKPYVDASPATDKIFLITVDAINNYFMDSTYAPALLIDTQENIEEHLGEIDCDCEKVSEQPLICASFNTLQIPSEHVKQILYNLSYINQAQKSNIMINFNKVLNQYHELYDTVIANTIGEGGFIQYSLGEGGGYYYMDASNQAGIYINTLILVIMLPSGETFYVPLYKVLMVFPFKMNDYYYTFLYVDNEPPARVGENKQPPWFSRQPDTHVTADYYNFVAEKINWYLQRFNRKPQDFIAGRYKGPDYISYNASIVKGFKKTHKPYAYTYKTPKFVPPEQTPITSPRLLGGKMRHRHRKTKRKTHVKKNKTKKVKKSVRRKKYLKKRTLKYKI